MKCYTINEINNLSGFNFIVTLLDYKVRISHCLESIKIPSNHTGKILVDAAICSGDNEYRFIEANVNKNGSIDLSSYQYITVDSTILKLANNLLKCKQKNLRNSVLTERQIKKILS